ncbi:AAA family ATPase [Comamonas testosteroni]|uniref:AAA family ATPase n=1 Tax=Comamonas testosteroni TaxID=285 RepID=UPI0009B8C894|nr:ATP-binding protein [Comamonas testosteroni]
MILEYGVSNYLSFKDGGVISFRLDGHVPDSVSGGLNYATIFCVKGANGSGKTHLLKGIAFLSSFISTSFTSYAVDEDISIAPFGSSKDFSSFYVDFLIDDDEYRYELDAHPDHVVREVLFRKRKRRTQLFERKGDVIVAAVNEFEWMKHLKYRKNASVISTAHQHEIPDFKKIYDLFFGIRFNVSCEGLQESDFANISEVSKFLSDKDDARQAVEIFLKDCDTGVSEIKILNERSSNSKKNIYYPIFLHKCGDEEIWVPIGTESKGTVQLFRQAVAYFFTIKSGTMLVMDELDQYLHPDLINKILKLFLSKNLNDRGAQLLFTSHQNDVMDICGKYRTSLVAKKNNMSYTYRLDELPGDMLRNDRPISPLYKSGRLGGVPEL